MVNGQVEPMGFGSKVTQGIGAGFGRPCLKVSPWIGLVVWIWIGLDWDVAENETDLGPTAGFGFHVSTYQGKAFGNSGFLSHSQFGLVVWGFDNANPWLL